MKLTLYMKPDCHLCEDALVQLREVVTRYALEIETVDISKDGRLMSTYGLRIPVVRIGDRELDAPLTRGDIERALNEEARRQQARSEQARGSEQVGQ